MTLALQIKINEILFIQIYKVELLISSVFLYFFWIKK